MSNVSQTRIYLSPPELGHLERSAVLAALESGWAAPVGPDIDLFEENLQIATARDYAVATSSGTAALHLGLLALGVESGDDVVVPTLTFAATAFAVKYVGANPVLVDVEDQAWTLDPEVLGSFLRSRLRENRLPAAVVTVDLFGRPCNYSAVLEICETYGVPVLVDAAEALGAQCSNQPAGAVGACAVLSFNGNKIITTSGGGALVTDDPLIAGKVRKWATQSREPHPWYEHEEIGFNYRMSNILAALGRAQLSRLGEVVERRRAIRNRYAARLDTLPGITVINDPPWGRWNGWLTTARFDPSLYPEGSRRVREALEAANIEARPVWKPMHQQPVFRDAPRVLTGVADRIFGEGLCMPSGTGMVDDDVDRVLEVLMSALE